MSLKLTPAEVRVIERLAIGWTNPQIAHKLGIALSATQTRVAAAKARNDISTTHHLIALWAVEDAIKKAIAEMERNKCALVK